MSMLVLSRDVGECVVIGRNIRVCVVEKRNGKVRLGIEAPKSIEVHREEVLEAILRQEAKDAH